MSGFIPLGHKPFDYEKLANFTDLRNGLADIHSDIEMAIDAIDKADLSRSVDAHMQAAMILSGVEIKMANFTIELRKKFLT